MAPDVGEDVTHAKLIGARHEVTPTALPLPGSVFEPMAMKEGTPW